MKNKYKYGSYASEQNRNKYFDIEIYRDGQCFHTTAVIYPYSVNVGDVSVHTFCNKKDGEKCTYSPTGFCNCYDEIKYSSVGNMIFSPKIVAEILIERLEKVVPGFTEYERTAIREMIYNEVQLIEEKW